VKTTFDLPDQLVRRAKALAARQGRALRDLVAEAIDDRLVTEPSEVTDRQVARASRRESWDAWRARLVEEPDGAWRNPDGVDDESFFETLDDTRREPWARRELIVGDGE
jgi:hypothetical protein